MPQHFTAPCMQIYDGCRCTQIPMSAVSGARASQRRPRNTPTETEYYDALLGLVLAAAALSTCRSCTLCLCVRVRHAPATGRRGARPAWHVGAGGRERTRSSSRERRDYTGARAIETEYFTVRAQQPGVADDTNARCIVCAHVFSPFPAGDLEHQQEVSRSVEKQWLAWSPCWGLGRRRRRISLSRSSY